MEDTARASQGRRLYETACTRARAMDRHMGMDMGMGSMMQDMMQMHNRMMQQCVCPAGNTRAPPVLPPHCRLPRPGHRRPLASDQLTPIAGEGSPST